MAQLKVIIVGTSPAETLRLEEALHDTGYLGTFRYTSLEPTQDRMPDWAEWDMIVARYHENISAPVLSLLAPVLRKSEPPVIFLVDAFQPLLVNHLINIGARRVFPMDTIEDLLKESLGTILAQHEPAARPKQEPPDREGKFRTVALNSLLPQLNNFAHVFRSSPIGFGILRLQDGKVIDCNPSMARLLDSTREELLGQELLELELTPDIRQQIQRAALIPEPQPELTQFERKIYTRSRQIRHVMVIAESVRWLEEDSLFILLQDMTETVHVREQYARLNSDLDRLVQVRTRALEDANRELEHEFAQRKHLENQSNQLLQVFWETPDVVVICGKDGRMQFLNRAGCQLFGMDQEEAVSHLDVYSIYSEKTRNWVRQEIMPIILRDGIWRGETEFQHKDGRVVPLSQVLLCKRDENGQVLYFASISRDVSNFKQVEQELRQSEERYRTLSEAAHDLIFMVSKDGRMEYANVYACKALGFSPDVVVNMPANQFFPKDFAANHLQMFSDVHEIDQATYTEGPFFRNSEQFWLGTWLVPIHNSQGELASILGISRDITEQKKTDEALQRALQNERKLGEMRSNFFSMTSHQFRTPLSTILLSAELLQKYGQRWDEQKRGEHLGRIQEAARRLNSMLEDILVIGRVESGRYVCIPKEFDLIEYCGQAIHEMALVDRNEHSLTFSHDMEELEVYLDPDVLQRIIDNLLSNAFKYSPRGSHVSVSVKVENTDCFMLEVTDQGIGIPERDLKYLFQPFQRGSNAAEFPGTGIGLTIIQKSVELMKGSVSLKSKEGQGTTFMVRLPIHYENEADRIFA